MANYQFDVFQDEVMHDHSAGDVLDLTTTLDTRYLSLTGSLADVTNHSHTVLTDIGTNTHAAIDTFIGTTVPATYAPLASPTFTTQIITPLIYGSSVNNGDITINGTSSATKTTSYVILQPTSGNVGIGTTAPGAKLDILQPWNTTPAIRLGDVTTDATQKLGRMSLRSYTNSEEDITMFFADANGTDNIIKYGGGTAYGNTATKLTFWTAANTTTTTGTERMRIGPNGGLSLGSTYVDTDPGSGSMIISGNVGIGTTAPTNILSVGGNSARIIWLERHSTSNTAGNTLTIQAGGATVGATDKAGGNLILAPGLSTGTGNNQILLQTSTSGTTGTADNALVTRVTLDSAALASTVPVRLKGYTVATLPATPTQGDTAFCTDLLTPTFFTVAVGGGAVVGVVFYNGSIWITI